MYLDMASASLLTVPIRIFKVRTEAEAFQATGMEEPDLINLTEFSQPSDLIIFLCDMVICPGSTCAMNAVRGWTKPDQYKEYTQAVRNTNAANVATDALSLALG